ncbi:MAG: baseplate J/gp47 family protein [Lachnospiraceae bacterium]|nr:baseplate J/gp47 family protein [Lachnospiraceae bacterium]
MDNTELHYVTYDPDEIWDEMIYNYVEAGGDILYPGDEKEMLLRGVLSDIVQVLAGVDNALRMQTLRYAVGEYLDIIGEKRGCERIAAGTATATVIIKTNALGVTDVVEAGTAMSSDGENYYLLSEDLILNGEEQQIEAEITAAEPGKAGNGLIVGKEMIIAIQHPAINSIVVKTAASGGSDEESDDDYRERIREYGLASITTGPKQQYESVTEGVSAEIVDAKAINNGAGEVGIYLVVADGANSKKLIEAVSERLNASDVRPLTDHVTVYESEKVPYVLNVEYMTDNSSAIASAVANVIAEYQAWQDNEIGRAFNPDRLMAALYTAGATRVIWNASSTFNGNNAITYTEIDEKKHCSGIINATAIS